MYFSYQAFSATAQMKKIKPESYVCAHATIQLFTSRVEDIWFLYKYSIIVFFQV